jgi:hypothetical protein
VRVFKLQPARRVTLASGVRNLIAKKAVMTGRIKRPVLTCACTAVNGRTIEGQVRIDGKCYRSGVGEPIEGAKVGRLPSAV